MHKEAQEENKNLKLINSTIYDALSTCGRNIFLPKCIPLQADQSKNCTINATIGQITDGIGNPIPLSPILEKLDNLNHKDIFLYSPIGGREKIRKLWHTKCTKEDQRMNDITLPIVTAGICHALSMSVELFCNPGDVIIMPDLHWDNYEHIFSLYPNIVIKTFNFYNQDGKFNINDLEMLLNKTYGKIQILFNFPSNPNGYSPTEDEIIKISNILVKTAKDRPVIVYCDDAYHGLIFESNVTKKSLFFELINRNPNLIPLKCDGITKELSFFGGRVGFLSFGVDKQAAAILANKCMGLIRARIGSPVTISQYLAEIELSDSRHEHEFEKLRLILSDRYTILKEVLTKPNQHWNVFPFNSGCFCLLKLRDGLNAEYIRQQLILDESVGVVSYGESYIRIAFCSIRTEDIIPLVRALERVCQRN